MSDDSLDQEESTARLRQRLWGAAVLIAILVIVLPLVLDGSGSESQFRRVERLREEPPRVLGADGRPEQRVEAASQTNSVPQATGASAAQNQSSALRIRVGEDDPPDYLRPPEESGQARDATRGAEMVATPDERKTAWVVQAGSFGDETNALAVRDRLRRAGFPSFVSPAGDAQRVFRVRVGPMIDAFRAQVTRDAVVDLLGRDAIVVPYP